MYLLGSYHTCTQIKNTYFHSPNRATNLAHLLCRLLAIWTGISCLAYAIGANRTQVVKKLLESKAARWEPRLGGGLGSI